MNQAEPQVGCFRRLFSRRTSSWRSQQSRDEPQPPRQPQLEYHEVQVRPEGYGTEIREALKISEKEKQEIHFFNPSCNYSYSEESEWWLDPQHPPSYTPSDLPFADLEVAKTVEATLDSLSPQLRELSLEIHGCPELQFQERYAHDILTQFMATHGFHVSRHYLGLHTAWRAEFSYGTGGRVIGVNSEMDALKGLGHACGHNLIAVSGVGIAIAIKSAMQAHKMSGKVVLLGTPAEEAGGGKVILLDRGGYKDMDACIMCHPSPGIPHSACVGTSIAMQDVEVEYFGQSAHAAAAPWEGTNALDAAFLAYSGISLLRQQMKPDHRIHGIVQGKDWSPNVIPDYAQMRWIARAPTVAELHAFVKRATNCLEAAAISTSCKATLKFHAPYFELRQNSVLARAFSDTALNRYGVVTSGNNFSASTDFGNVSYALPSLHPSFAIPTEAKGGNHTPAFAKSAATVEAHAAMMCIAKVLALTGYRILADAAFCDQVKRAFEAQK